jgi:hypothetical protein
MCAGIQESDAEQPLRGTASDFDGHPSAHRVSGNGKTWRCTGEDCLRHRFDRRVTREREDARLRDFFQLRGDILPNVFVT